jgi:IclR family transcriptional regulator, pca regulon regulatory protein
MDESLHDGDEDEQSPAARFAPLRLSKSLQKGLALLPLFSGQRPDLGIFEIAELTGLSRGTTHRYASTLVHLGYLEQNSSQRYLLAPRAADPGLSLIASMRRALPVLDVLEELRDEAGYTVSLGVLGPRYVTYVHRLFGHRRGQYRIDGGLGTGARIPLYCTALGKVLLASLTGMWRRKLISGIDFVPRGPRSITTHEELIDELETLDLLEPVVSNEELVAGGRSIAMYVPRPHEEQPIAIDVTVPSTDFTSVQLRKQIGPHIKYAAKLISQAGRDEPRPP